MKVPMLEFMVMNDFDRIRFIRPLVTESEEHFRQRMDALAQVLAEQASDFVAVILTDGEGCPFCLVSDHPVTLPQS